MFYLVCICMCTTSSTFNPLECALVCNAHYRCDIVQCALECAVQIVHVRGESGNVATIIIAMFKKKK